MTRKRFTRREFLEQAARRAAGAGLTGAGLARAGLAGAGMAGMTLPILSCSPADQEPALPPLPLDEKVLAAVIDEIIPASDGMPSASEAGVLRYFRQLAAAVSEQSGAPVSEPIAPPVPDLTETLGGALEAVGIGSRERFGGSFLELTASQRVEVLEQVEEADADLFGGLSTLVYEAYYVQPPVWELLGYEPYPTGESGPRMDPFDETALDRVRSTPTLYREVL